MELNKVYNDDCFNVFKDIPDESVHLILCDLPYQITDYAWDKIKSMDELWKEYERIITPNGSIVLTASGSFTNKLIFSNQKLFKYKWIWLKGTKGNFMNCKNRPMTQFEEILVFSKASTGNGSKNKMVYNPQGVKRIDKIIKSNDKKFTLIKKRPWHSDTFIQEYSGYPSDVLTYSITKEERGLHPTVKPVALFEYLINTYTNEGDIVLDNCAGCGTTGVAAIKTNRNFILIEKEKKYYDIINQRLK